MGQGKLRLSLGPQTLDQRLQLGHSFFQFAGLLQFNRFVVQLIGS